MATDGDPRIGAEVDVSERDWGMTEAQLPARQVADVMKKLLCLPLLIVGILHAQSYSMGNLGTAINYAAFTTGLPSPCINAPIYTVTDTRGIATMTTALSMTGTGCSSSFIVGKTFSIVNTYTDYDGGPYTILSSPSSTSVTFSTTNTDGFNHTPTYSHAQSVVKDASGNLWQFYHLASGEGGAPSRSFPPGCVAVKKSTNNGSTWTNPANLFCDSSGLCNGDTANCDERNQETGLAANGNLVIWFWRYDWNHFHSMGLFSATCAPSSTNCTLTSNWTISQITLTPSGQKPGSWFWGSPYGTMVQLPGGALGATSVGNVSTQINAPAPTYMLISCDNGATWGTGNGCNTAQTSQYLIGNCGTACRRISVAPYGTNNYTAPPNNEFVVSWVGGSTLLLFARNNMYTSGGGCTTPCGPMVMMYSNDLGMTWTEEDTNIFGTGVGHPCPISGTVIGYTEVSPIIFNPNLGNGLWGLIWGDRMACTAEGEFQLDTLLFNPASVIASPTSFPTRQVVFTGHGGDTLCGYPAITPIGGSNSNQVLLGWDDELVGSGPLSLWQNTANWRPRDRRLRQGHKLRPERRRSHDPQG